MSVWFNPAKKVCGLFLKNLFYMATYETKTDLVGVHIPDPITEGWAYIGEFD